MAEINKTTQQQYDRIHKNIRTWIKFFEKNVIDFKNSKKMVFESSMTQDDKNILLDQKRPTYEFNVLEPYISRLLGEFSIVNPQFKLLPCNDDAKNISTIDTVSSIIRAILYKSQSDSIDNEIYKDMLGGGFSAMRLVTKYRNESSFDQDILIERVYDPCKVGFDPQARMPHKGDGRYCYEIIPLSEEDFIEKYPDADIRNIKSSIEGIKWRYSDNFGNRFINVCEYFEVETKNIKLHLMGANEVMGIPDNTTFTDDELKALTDAISPGSPLIPPVPKQSEMREVKKYYRYRLTGGMFLESRKLTDFSFLPIFFFDGNSFFSDDKQTTRSYVYQAKDAQRAKNIVANIFLGEIQDIRRTRMTVSQEALPDDPDYIDSYIHPEKNYAALIYKQFDENGTPLQGPQIFPSAPIPPELFNTFSGMDNTIQNLLGSYDAQQGILSGDVSGRAIIAGATQSNAAAKPYMINYISTITQVLRSIVDLIPKIYVTPRTIPIVTASGQRSSVKINAMDGVRLDYDPNELDLYVSEGASFEIQKKEALGAMAQLSATNPGLNQLLSTKGLPIMLENLDIRGADKLQAMAEDAIKNPPPPPGPPPEIMLKLKDIELRTQQITMENQIKMAQLKMETDKMEFDRMNQLLEMQMKHADLVFQKEKLEQETMVSMDDNRRAEQDQQLRATEQAIKMWETTMDHHQRIIDREHKKAYNNPPIETTPKE